MPAVSGHITQSGHITPNSGGNRSIETSQLYHFQRKTSGPNHMNLNGLDGTVLAQSYEKVLWERKANDHWRFGSFYIEWRHPHSKQWLGNPYII